MSVPEEWFEEAVVNPSAREVDFRAGPVKVVTAPDGQRYVHIHDLVASLNMLRMEIEQAAAGQELITSKTLFDVVDAVTTLIGSYADSDPEDTEI